MKRSGLGGHVTNGMAWMLLSTFIAKGGSFAAQIVLGWLLLKEDFGVYAIAISVSSFVQVLKDGGTRKIIVQKGSRRFDRLCPAVFWMASGFNILTALIMVGISIPVSRLYGESQLVSMLMVFALGTLLGTPGTMYRAKLSVELRYRELARFEVLSGTFRNASMIVFAVLGMGAMSFAWPLVCQSVFGWVLGLWMCGRLPIWGKLRLRLWPLLFMTTVWMLVGAIGLTILRLGSYGVIGYFQDPVVLGVYFFAFQLILQIDMVVSVNLQSVLLPTLSAIKAEHARHRDAVIRSAGALLVIGSAAGMSIACGIPELIRFIWAEKWLDAIPAVQWMAVFFPFRMLQGVFEPAMISKGLYRRWACLMIAQAFVIILASLVAGIGFEHAWEFAMVVGVGIFVGMMLVGSMGAVSLGISFRDLSGTLFPAWVLALVSFGFVLWIRSVAGFGDDAPRVELAGRGLVSGVGFLVVYGALLRVLLPGVLLSTIGALPGRARPLAMRAMMIRAKEEGS